MVTNRDVIWRPSLLPSCGNPVAGFGPMRSVRSSQFQFVPPSLQPRNLDPSPPPSPSRGVGRWRFIEAPDVSGSRDGGDLTESAMLLVRALKGLITLSTCRPKYSLQILRSPGARSRALGHTLRRVHLVGMVSVSK